MNEVTVYHNPRCSKSRHTLDLLEREGIKPKIIEYLSSPPSTEELSGILEKLGISARDLMRKNEAEYKENSLDNPSLSEELLIDALARHPKLMERPIVLANGKAAICRPPERVFEIL